MMQPWEIVKAALYFKKPPRLPVGYRCFGCEDRAWMPMQPAASFTPSQPGEDEWGCVWAKTDMHNMGQVRGHPLEDLPDDLSKTKSPDYDDDTRYAKVPEALDQAEREGTYVVAGLFMVLFERMHTLHGFENTLCDLLTDRPAAEALADHIVDVHLAYIRNLSQRFGTRIHAISMTDDWGTQQAAFISQDLWMDLFFPRYKRLFDAMHEAGYDVWVHSCGKVNEIVECYLRAGVNIVNLQQPRALGIEEMGRRYRGRIAFESLCDIQHTLPTGDRKQIEADVEALMTHWATRDGGFFFADYGDDAAIGVRKPEAKLYMYEQFSKWSEKLYGQPLPPPQVPQKV